MGKIITKLIEKKDVARDTMSFLWEKPEGFTFRAGQNLDWTQVNPQETDSGGTTHTFTIVAAPFENHLMFATRMRDTAFKRNLKRLSPGDEIEIEGPYGSFTLHNNPTRPAIFLTGGIGITPVISIIKQATHDNLSHKMFLFSSNKTTKDAPFADELNTLSNKNQNFKFIPSITREVDWPGERGRITFDLIKKYVEETNDAIFYISGPMPMVEALRQILIDAKTDEDNIRTEDFPGY